MIKQRWMLEIKENNGINKKIVLVLAEKYIKEVELTEEEAAYFRVITQMDKEKVSPIIMGKITKAGYQQTFQVAKEATSSSTSGLHYTT